MKIFAKLLLIFITICFTFPIQAQTDETTEVKIHQKIGSRYFRCFLGENKVYDEESLKKIASDKNCSAINLLKVDFTKQSLIGFRVGGDCFMRADSKVFRNERTKTYQVKIFNHWGGCRAGGSFVGWAVVDKIPDDYKIEFSVILAEKWTDSIDKFILDNALPTKDNRQVLESREINLIGCIKTHYGKHFIIKDEATYLKTIRNDGSLDHCLKNLEMIDFEKNSLLGLEINSGYYRRPIGLEFQVLKDESIKEYQFNIGYINPRGSVCRALSQYDLWVLVPKITNGFAVKFNVEAK